MSLSPLANGVAKNINRHMPTLLTALSVAGVVATAYLFQKAGKQSTKDLESEDPEMRWDEKFMVVWPNYLIPTSIGIATVVCMISANVLNTQRQATLIGAYALAERTIAKYRGKVAEMLGLDNERVIREQIVKDVAKETVVSPEVYGTGEGVVYLDVFSGQQFFSDDEAIRRAMDDTNAKCEEDGFASMNYFYDRIGARTTQLGELLGWSDGLPLEVVLTPVVFENGTEGFGLDYVRMPFMGYHEV